MNEKTFNPDVRPSHGKQENACSFQESQSSYWNTHIRDVEEEEEENSRVIPQCTVVCKAEPVDVAEQDNSNEKADWPAVLCTVDIEPKEEARVDNLSISNEQVVTVSMQGYQSHFQNHLRPKRKSKQFFCDKCHKSFSTKSCLTQQMLMHCRDKRNFCEECITTINRNNEPTQEIPKSRKTIENAEKWALYSKKNERYSEVKSPQMANCQHDTAALKCMKLTLPDIIAFSNNFYQNKTKVLQDAFILQSMEVHGVHRRRPTTGKYSKRTTNTRFFVMCPSEELPVCQTTFMNILGITRGRIRTIVKNFKNDNNVPREKRGGDNRSVKYDKKKTNVSEFLSSLNCVETHYCSGTERRYLSTELNINKIWSMYNSVTSPELTVKNFYFRDIFNGNFNLGFRSPQTDKCATCNSLTDKIERSQSELEKNNLISTKRVHRLRSKAFYKLVQEEKSNLLTLSFDMQKNLPLPKIPEPHTYFCKKLNFYNFTIFVNDVKEEPAPGNCFSYCWTEDEYEKGSNQIASALHHRLLNTDLINIETIRLICNGCYGKKRNKALLAMCCRWILHAPSQIKSLQIVFPIRGHTSIPPNRVFANIEKKLRKQEVIATPEEYCDIIRQDSTVLRPGIDFLFNDWLREADDISRTMEKWHFDFSRLKRIFIKRSNQDPMKIVIKGGEFYKSMQFSYKGILRHKEPYKYIREIEYGNMKNIKQEKLKDVNRLLEIHYGQNWGNDVKLQYYKKCLQLMDSVTFAEKVEEEEELCEPNHEENIAIIRM